MKNSELIARLIYGTWIGPAFDPEENVQEDAPFKAFTAALELYAKEAREEENTRYADEVFTFLRENAVRTDCHDPEGLAMTPHPSPAATPSPQGEGKETPALSPPGRDREEAPDTHTHTGGAL